MLFCPLYAHRKWISKKVTSSRWSRQRVTEKGLKPIYLPPKFMFFPISCPAFFLIHLNEHWHPCLERYPFFLHFTYALKDCWSRVGGHNRWSVKGILDRCLIPSMWLARTSLTSISSFDLAVSRVSIKLLWFWILKKKNSPKKHQQKQRE